MRRLFLLPGTLRNGSNLPTTRSIISSISAFGLFWNILVRYVNPPFVFRFFVRSLNVCCSFPQDILKLTFALIDQKLQQRKQLAMRELLRLALIDWSGGRWEDREALKAGFVAHNNNIRRLVPSEILLEFSPKQGWAPLCEFLGKEIPNEPFPYVNKGDHSTNIFFAAIVVRLVTSYWMHAIGLSGAVVALVWMRRS